jgi:hypothetical protein
MNKKLAHIILFVGNFFCLGIFWMGLNDFNHTLSEINLQPDSISFGSRNGFFMVTIGFPLIYLGIMIEHFRPDWIKKYSSFCNYAAAGMIIILLAAGFIGSSWIRFKVENAGYVYCRNASGISALERTLVYTKTMDTCNELVEAKLKEKRERN